MDEFIFFDNLYHMALINIGHSRLDSINNSWYAANVRTTYVILEIMIERNTYVRVGKTIALSAQYRFARRSFSMKSAKLMASIDAVKLDWSLPVLFLIPSLLCFLINLLPPALWAGALTPTPASKNTSSIIRIQSYDKFPWLSKYGLIQDDDSMPGPYPASVNEAEGIFTFMPQDNLQGVRPHSLSPVWLPAS